MVGFGVVFVCWFGFVGLVECFVVFVFCGVM